MDDPKTTRPATSDETWMAIRFMARHVFCCWPRRWEHIGQVRTCLHCGLKLAAGVPAEWEHTKNWRVVWRMQKAMNDPKTTKPSRLKATIQTAAKLRATVGSQREAIKQQRELIKEGDRVRETHQKLCSFTGRC